MLARARAGLGAQAREGVDHRVDVDVEPAADQEHRHVDRLGADVIALLEPPPERSPRDRVGGELAVEVPTQSSQRARELLPQRAAGEVDVVGEVERHHHRHRADQVRRARRRGAELRGSQRRRSPGSDLAVRPRLRGDPLDGVVAVVGAAGYCAAGASRRCGRRSSSPVGHDERIGGIGEERALAPATLALEPGAHAALVVGRLDQDHRPRPGGCSGRGVARQVDVGGELGSVAHRDAHLGGVERSGGREERVSRSGGGGGEQKRAGQRGGEPAPGSIGRPGPWSCADLSPLRGAGCGWRRPRPKDRPPTPPAPTPAPLRARD